MEELEPAAALDFFESHLVVAEVGTPASGAATKVRSAEVFCRPGGSGFLENPLPQNTRNTRNDRLDLRRGDPYPAGTSPPTDHRVQTAITPHVPCPRHF